MSNAFPIVGIGASAGGLEAYKQFFEAMPADSGMAFVLIQHLDPTHESMMVELLDKHTTMSVQQADDGQTIEQNTVYVIPPNRYLSLVEGKLYLRQPEEPRGMRMAIDTFFKSLAEDQQERAIGIVLSGTGSDGSSGLQAIKAHGGLALAQDPDQATHAGMPRSAINTGIVDMVRELHDMPNVLLDYAQHPYVQRDGETSPVGEDLDQLNAILSLLLARRGINFRHYKRATLVRRIERRMGLHQIESLSAYLDFLRRRSEEVERLNQDLLIGVTSFFRDPLVFQTLNRKVIGEMVETADPDEGLRIWVPGCSTGEEAYSIAMLLNEQLDRANRRLRVQIFASDIDEEALARAREGAYPVSAATDMEAAMLDRYFDRDENDRLRVRKVLRDMVVFAKQNLISDPPFSKMDLISCRNLMIYLQPQVQDQLISLMHFALKPGGVLLLGSSESIGRQTDQFEPIDKKLRIYRRLNNSHRQAPEMPLSGGGRDRASRATGLHLANRDRTRPSLAKMADRWILETVSPASILVNNRAEALYFSGPVERYLRLPQGEAKMRLLDMVREGLSARVRAAIHRAFEKNERVVVAPARMRRDEQLEPVRIEVVPLQEFENGEGFALVSFVTMARDTSDSDGDGDRDTVPASESLVRQLEDELRATREDLQSTIEEMETANEELQASNEEVMSVNEELQSTNEELETSKEELQSLNEELSTVNNELEDKVSELEHAHNDIINLLNSSDVATLFLDPKLCIKRYTPSIKQLFNLLPADVGRPMADIMSQVDDPDLLTDARQVLERLLPQEKTVRGREDGWYVRRILPYRTEDNKIDGVVITYSDITDLREAERMATLRLAQLESIYQSAPIGLAFHDHEGRYLQLNQRLAEITGISVEDSRGRRVSELVPKPMGREIEEVIARVYASGEAVSGQELRGDVHAHPGIMCDWRVSFRPVINDRSETMGVISVVEDITEHKQEQRRLVASRTVAKIISNATRPDTIKRELLDVFIDSLRMSIAEYWELDSAGDGLLHCTHFSAVGTERTETVLQQLFDETTFAPGEGLVGHIWQDQEPRWLPDVKQTDEFQRVSEAEALGLRSAFGFPVIIDGRPEGVVACFSRERLPNDKALKNFLAQMGRDIGQGLRRTRIEGEMRQANIKKTEFLSTLGHELRNPLAALSSAAELARRKEERREWALDVMQVNIRMMTRLLDDLLDLNRIDQGKIQLKPRVWDLRDLLENVTSSLQSKSLFTEQHFSLNLQDLPMMMEVDRTRFEQMLANLLSNASKFSDEDGHIEIQSRRRGNRVEIAVSDDGRGLREEDLERIFLPFEQIDPDVSNQGLGIGLALVRQLAELHGGNVSASSAGLGKGATFTITLPLSSDLLDCQSASGDFGGKLSEDLKILCVDDNTQVLETLTEIISDWGCQTDAAQSGAEALEKVASLQPDICIIDIGLPEMDGYEIAEKIRASDTPQPFLVALTGFGEKASEDHAKTSGFDIYLTKPPDFDDLYRLICEFARSPTAD